MWLTKQNAAFTNAIVLLKQHAMSVNVMTQKPFAEIEKFYRWKNIWIARNEASVNNVI